MSLSRRHLSAIRFRVFSYRSDRLFRTRHANAPEPAVDTAASDAANSVLDAAKKFHAAIIPRDGLLNGY